MNYGRRNNPGSNQIAIAIVAALLGLLLALNAATTDDVTLRAVNAVGAGIFLITASISIFKTEE